MTAGIALMTTGGFASAAEGPEEENGFYASAGLSRLDLDFRDARFTNSAGESVSGKNLGLNFDSVRLISLATGYNWGRWAVELGYEQSLGSGDLKIDRSNIHGDFDYANFRLAGVYRSAGTIYFLGKAGITIPDLETDFPGTHFDMDASEFIGLGGGYRFSPQLSLEAEASLSGDDTATYTLSLRRKF
jgi:hypothetical protein